MFKRLNWPLLLGLAIVLGVTGIAVWGPQLAPHDPNQTNYIIRVGQEWISAPFPPLRIPGFPLGSDQQGRDVLSQLLWAVRPTMILVAIVSVIRLVAGTLFGLVSGWATGRVGRALEATLSAALSVPVLIVSLAVIAAVGIELGVWAFILGLAATGWAETARFVREQTRMIKGQLYVEAGRALGLTDLAILTRHVLGQIRPALWMLFSFEVSNTLLAAAALGFLGYFLGGEVWTAISDTTAQRSHSVPELGLMLSTLTTDMLVGPWKMVAAGTMVFTTVLGFNLLGEGLRLELDPERARRAMFLLAAKERVALWLDDRLLYPISNAARKQAANPAIVGLFILLATAGVIWWRAQAAPRPAAIPGEMLVPGGHLWATQRHDPWGTLQTEAIGPQNPETLWVFEAHGFSGGPAVAANGDLYVSSQDMILYAINPGGEMLWQADLPAVPVGSPALDEEGRIYVADEAGGLSAVSPDGHYLWHFQPDEDFMAATSGPTVAPDGTIYFTLGGTVQAVSSGGQPLWKEIARPYRTSNPPYILPEGELIYLEDTLMEAEGGLRQQFSALTGANQFLVGGNGNPYLRLQHFFIEWRQGSDGVELGKRLEWNWQRVAFGVPRDAGITKEGYAWLLYWTGFEDARLAWIDMDGRVLSNAHFPQRPARVVAIDGESTAYSCGLVQADRPECLAIKPGSDDPAWQIALSRGGAINGGALVTGRLYVTQEDGHLYALGQP